MLNAFARKDDTSGHPDNAEIDAKTFSRRIVSLDAELRMSAGVQDPTLPTYLCQTRNTGPHTHTLPIALRIPEIGVVAGHLRPRSHQFHLTLQNVPQLWPFIHMNWTEDAAKRRYAWIVEQRAISVIIRAFVHSTKLVHKERNFIAPKSWPNK